MVGIYKIVNPNGKIYIGQSVNIFRRFAQYSQLSKNCIGPKLFNSLNKYGYLNHEFSLIDICHVEDLNHLETLWKKFYLFKLGWEGVLFLSLYDNGGGPKSNIIRNKMSKTHSLLLTTPEMVSKRVIKCKNSCTFYTNKLKVQNTDWEKRNNNLKKPRKRYKKIEQYTLDGKLLNTFSKVKDLLKEFGNPKPQNLYSCLRGEYKTWMGYKWKGFY